MVIIVEAVSSATEHGVRKLVSLYAGYASETKSGRVSGSNAVASRH